MTCARCGADESELPSLNRHRDYQYCEDCKAEFADAAESGVTVRSRHGNIHFEMRPYEITTGEDVSSSLVDENNVDDQTDALVKAKRIMEANGVRGVFIYQETGSVWLVDEYLDAHPSIKQTVEDRVSSSGGLISRLFS